MATKPIPDAYHSVTPYLIIRGAERALAYYKKVFGALEIARYPDPSGKLAHAEIKIGDSAVMMADEFPDMGFKSPDSIGGTPVGLLLYVENVDEVFARAIAEGGREMQPVADQFYGDRSGTLADPFGHVWTLATHVEDVSPEEMQRRMEEMARKQATA